MARGIMYVESFPSSPDREQEYNTWYNEVHLPLVQKTPGLAKAEVCCVTANAMGGEVPYFLIAEMTYPDKATFDAAMASPENPFLSGRVAMEMEGVWIDHFIKTLRKMVRVEGIEPPCP